MGRSHSSIARSIAVVLVALGCALAAGCSGGAEQPILNQYFTASRLRDNSTLANFSTVAFEPRVDGTVGSFTIQSVSPEQRRPLNAKGLAKLQEEAKAADADYTKRKEAYENANLEAIKRVLDARSKKTALKGSDAEVQATWTKFLDEGTQVSKRVFETRRSFASETSVAALSVDDPRNPVDLTKYDGEMASKDVTITASVRLPTEQTVQKTLIVTLQRAELKGDHDITGRWIITGIRDASPSGATTHS
jgi:hypothetical protein